MKLKCESESLDNGQGERQGDGGIGRERERRRRRARIGRVLELKDDPDENDMYNVEVTCWIKYDKRGREYWA